jgi:hypothetical protein
MTLGFLYIIESIQEPAGISKDRPERSDQGRAPVAELETTTFSSVNN